MIGGLVGVGQRNERSGTAGVRVGSCLFVLTKRIMDFAGGSIKVFDLKEC